MTYQPKPIDTKSVPLPKEFSELCESLARNAHDVWALQRLNDQWGYGPVRDDAKKEHPCLVPYEDLPEGEKDMDRVMVAETLKCIVALGYQIVRK